LRRGLLKVNKATVAEDGGFEDNRGLQITHQIYYVD